MVRRLVEYLERKGPQNSLAIEAWSGWESLTVHACLLYGIRAGWILQKPPGIFGAVGKKR